MGRMPRGASDAASSRSRCRSRTRIRPLLVIDDPPRGILGGNRLAIVQEIDTAGQAIGIVAFRFIDHEASLRNQLDLLGAEIFRHVHFRCRWAIARAAAIIPSGRL